jgi:fucose 4-O-acetylase-like acetyltransferase
MIARNNTPNARWNWIDSAKGIGIILVVYGHVARGLKNSGIYLDYSTFELIDNIIYSFHMPLFFFLSGIFCISSFEKRGVKLVFNKVNTIFYPYLLWSLIQGSLELGLSSYINQHATWSNLLNIIWQPHDQFWFLYTLFFVFVYNISLLFVMQRFEPLKRSWPLIMPLTALILLVCKPYLPGLYLFQSVATYDIYFAFGAIFLLLYKKGEVIGVWVLVLVSMLFIAMEYATFFSGVIIFRQSFASILLACIGIFTVVSIAQRIPVFARIGVYSMEIYLMHIIFGSGIRILLQKVMSIGEILPHLMIGVLAGVLLPVLAARWIKKFKLDFLFFLPRVLRTSN